MMRNRYINAVLLLFGVLFCVELSAQEAIKKRNALDFSLNWVDSSSIVKRVPQSLGQRSYLSVGMGMSDMFSLYSNKATISRIGLGMWMTPVSGVEIGGVFDNINLSDSELNANNSTHKNSNGAYLSYMLNFSNLLFPNRPFTRLSVINTYGIDYRSPSQLSSQSVGVHIGLKIGYKIKEGFDLFAEYNMSAFDKNYIQTSYYSRPYNAVNSLTIGMAVTLRNINRATNKLFEPLDRDDLPDMTYAVKTNLLYGAATFTPNIGIEFKVMPRMTLDMGVGYNFINKGESNVKKLEHALYYVSPRYWFDSSFNGGFVGVVGLFSQFDVSKYKLPLIFGDGGDKYRNMGYALGSGVSVGYQWRVARNISIETELAVGYAKFKYNIHDPENQDIKLTDGYTRNYFGPIKAGISLVYLFNVEKGLFPKNHKFVDWDNQKNFTFALKTNLLYGGIAKAINLGLEIGLDRNVTLDASVGYNPWFREVGGARKMVHSMYQIGPRYWINRRFDGLFVGAHGLITSYNVSRYNLPLIFGEDGSEYRYEGIGYGAGLSVGYQWRIGKHFGIETEIGAGFAKLKYDKFDCLTCSEPIDRNIIKRNYVGPTKAAISLVYLFNVNKEKGQKLKFKELFPADHRFAEWDKTHRFSYALKTNLFYGALTKTPNIGFEATVGKKITIDASVGYNPWNKDKGGVKKTVHMMAQVGPRFWMRSSFDGLFFGAHTLFSTFNISKNNIPLMFGRGEDGYRFEGHGYGAGISAGYSWRMARRFNIETELGVGYARLVYDKYDCVTCGYRMGERIRSNYYGPTKASISLVYMFNNKYLNRIMKWNKKR